MHAFSNLMRKIRYASRYFRLFFSSCRIKPIKLGKGRFSESGIYARYYFKLFRILIPKIINIHLCNLNLQRAKFG